jgi:low temperature requirement protein LtrA/transcriptional regulator with XRE-family HTH domain
MAPMSTNERRNELGAFLKVRRQELRPDLVGLQASSDSRRRARDLRREEVASLASISTDYYARIERGRRGAPWATLDTIARVLRLDDAGRDYLFELSVLNADFRRWRSDHQVAARSRGMKEFRHPVVGDLTLDWDTLTCAGDPDQQLVSWSAEPGSPSYARLQALARRVQGDARTPAGTSPSRASVETQRARSRGGMMAVREGQWIKRDVSPLELFFDLVFVLAIGQLTHHVIAHLTVNGAAETVIMLVAVCGVWAFTTFEITLLDVERAATRAVTVAVMGLGLFMNAGIAHAFGDGPWLFVVPLLGALAGPGAYAAATAPTAHLREHFVRVLIWVGASAPLWIAGALSDPEVRLWLWGGAAVVDLLGTFTAHPLPGRVVHTERLPFDAEHMLERMRLFLIILLGETVLSIGRVISQNHSDPLTLLAALGGFLALVSLWFIYFGRAEQVAITHAASVEDPIRTVHLGINVIYLVVLGLVVFAAGAELVIAHPEEPRAGLGGVLMLGGPALYLGAQAIYFLMATGHDWLPRVVGAIVLGFGAAAAYWLPAMLAVVVLVVLLVALAVHLARERAATPAEATSRNDPGGLA